MRTLLPAPNHGPSSPDSRITKPEQQGNTSKISSACLACKERKTKCSGIKPCAKCIAKKTNCVFDIASDARRKLNRARTVEISSQQRDLLTQLLKTLRYGEVEQIEKLLKVCRDGISWEQLVEEIYAFQDQISIPPASETQSRQKWPGITIRDPSLSQDSSSSHTSSIRHDSSSLMSVNRMLDTPVLRVSMRNWTKITEDNELISHLISLYFVWEHQTLPFVDRQLFLEDYKSGETVFCSPLLVNSILALGSRYSSRPEVCPAPDDSRPKGQSFETEAYRLWHLENVRPSLPSVQALCMLSWRATADGRDRLGRSLFREAVALSHDLGMHRKLWKESPEGVSNMSMAQRRLERGKSMTAWAIRNWSVIHSTAVMKPLVINKTYANQNFPRTDLNHGREWWQPYPLPESQPQPSQFWPVFSSWCESLGTAEEIVSRLYPDPIQAEEYSSTAITLPEIELYNSRIFHSIDKFMTGVREKGLPTELPHILQYRAWNMSYALILYNTLTNSSDHQAVQERIFELCYHIKAIVTLYQQKYGLRFAQGIIMHPLVVISYSLLPRMQDLRSQPLIESCVWDMLEMVDNLKILKAVVHIYGIAARKAHIKWPTDLELALQECTPDPNICADYPVLGPNFTLDAGDGESESGRVARVSDLLEEWGEGGQQ